MAMQGMLAREAAGEDVGADGFLRRFQAFPGFKAAPGFLRNEIVSHNFRTIADLGGGANPMLDEAFVRERGLAYHVIDISASELAKASSAYEKICVDLAASEEVFLGAVPLRNVDLAFSHMFVEHLRDPDAVHRNIWRILRPGGLAVHFYPSPNSIPLFINKWTPPAIARLFLMLAQPSRSMKGHLGVFPAYYRLCGKSPAFIRKHFAELGFQVLRHEGFVGHQYYRRFPLLRQVEKALRGPVIRAGWRLTSFELLVLQKEQ